MYSEFDVGLMSIKEPKFQNENAQTILSWFFMTSSAVIRFGSSNNSFWDFDQDDFSGLNRLQSHCSGHSKGSYLLEVVKTIDSKMLYPIHTEHPDAYGKVTDKLTIVEEGKKYEVK